MEKYLIELDEKALMTVIHALRKRRTAFRREKYLAENKPDGEFMKEAVPFYEDEIENHNRYIKELESLMIGSKSIGILYKKQP